MNCVKCSLEIPAGLSLREQDGSIILDVWPRKDADGPYCGDCAETEGQRRAAELDADAASPGRDVKQLIVIRRDLRMRRGKEIAQGAHAAMAFLTNRLRRMATMTWMDDPGEWMSEAEYIWVTGSFKKVTCRVNSEAELRDVADRAREAGLHVEEIIDSGATEFDGVPTFTCIAIGPDFEDRFAGVTDDLELY